MMKHKYDQVCASGPVYEIKVLIALVSSESAHTLKPRSHCPVLKCRFIPV